MAVLGRCMECDRLVPLRVRPQPGSVLGRTDWYPLPHDHPTGGQCLGSSRKVG